MIFAQRRVKGGQAATLRRVSYSRSVADDGSRRMLGNETIPAVVASPEVADHIVGEKRGRFSCDHGVGANGADRPVCDTRG